MAEQLQNAINDIASKDSSIIPRISIGNEVRQLGTLSDAFSATNPAGQQLNAEFKALSQGVEAYLKAPLPTTTAPQSGPSQANDNTNAPSFSR